MRILTIREVLYNHTALPPKYYYGGIFFHEPIEFEKLWCAVGGEIDESDFLDFTVSEWETYADHIDIILDLDFDDMVECIRGWEL